MQKYSTDFATAWCEDIINFSENPLRFFNSLFEYYEDGELPQEYWEAYIIRCLVYITEGKIA